MNICEAKNYTVRQPPGIEEWPAWFDGKKINEVLFCEEFLQDHPMLCIHDAFFTTEGRVADETMLKKEILHSLYDRSVGFFRRQIILSAKERPANRVDDPFVAEKMCSEAESIFLWALEGLRRLIANHYRFTISQRAQENMKAAVADGNNIVEFMQSTGYIAFQPDAASSSKDLYAAYKLWCEDNAYNALSMKSFCNYLTQNAGSYHIEHTNNIYIGCGRRSRGFNGLQVLIPQF